MATAKTPAATPKKPAAKVAQTSTVKKVATATVEQKVAAPKVTAKATPAKAAGTPKVEAKPAVKKAITKESSSTPSAEERYRMVQDAAYYLAEKNHFKGGAMNYWVAAEREINEFLSGK